MSVPVVRTDFVDLTLLHRGKVRDMYGIPGHDDKLLMVATDRISAYDVVMADPIPDKGKILTRLSLFWFDMLRDIVPNHLITAEVDQYPEVCLPYREQLEGRSMLVRRTKVMPYECIVRGYLSGSFWQAYQKDTNVCGFRLPAGLRESDKFETTLFTPSTKAELGEHDENISLARMREQLGAEPAAEMADISVRLYEKAADYALGRGVIIADTKFEFGMADGQLMLIDEVLTPDSSRFWPLDQYRPGEDSRVLTNSFCATIFQPWTGINSRLLLLCPGKFLKRPGPAMKRPCTGLSPEYLDP